MLFVDCCLLFVVVGCRFFVVGWFVVCVWLLCVDGWCWLLVLFFVAYVVVVRCCLLFVALFCCFGLFVFVPSSLCVVC